VQAPQLRVDEVEAQHAGPRRAEEVLPLVRPPYGAPGDALMARQTRAERRARREARERSFAERPEVQATPRPALQTAPSHAGGRELPLAGARRFIVESIGELRKVEWPRQNQVIQGTVVVIIACVIIGSYLYLCDQVFNKLVSKVLLGQ
jgi:preprotein translocase subunit SecE